ncbi:MAG: zinc ribbon domain-containing protein [Myxococcales bacterium]|nr:zinc ribbon domain-containing protein [Myxococcales bacterium]MCB9543820.1 zinc ribbon domain-containing protein [Myxococcales bacterium]MCB9551821.1 zinc ribbon domain-containing protein [Myxococcales bacterium]
MTCPHCRRPAEDDACFCSACGQMLRRPPEGAPIAPAWQAWLGADDDDRPTLFGAPAIADAAGDTTPVAEPAPLAASLADDSLDGLDDFQSPLDPPEGFRETAWFLEAEDPDALAEIEQGDAPLTERGARYRRDRAVVEEAARRAYSLAYDPEDDP